MDYGVTTTGKTVPFSQLKCDLKVTEWHRSAIQSPFQTMAERHPVRKSGLTLLLIAI